MALVNKNFSDIITFTRASTATYFDSAGTLTSAAVDAPRFDYDPSTLAAQGLLIEEARTNLCLASEDFFQTGTGGVNWIWPAGVITGNTQVAPDGTVTADTCTTTGSAASIFQSITVTASTSYTFSLFVKLGTMSASNYKIAIYNNTAATFIATDVVPSQVPNTSSWTRVTYTFTTPVGCTSIRVYPFRNSATITSSTVFIWGAQLEAGAFPTSYIPTTTTALTRAADVASVNTLSPWYNATEGTLFAEGTVVDNIAGTTPRTFGYFSDPSVANVFAVEVRSSTSARARISTGGVTVNASDSVNVLGVNAKLAGAYGADGATICVNGRSPVTLASSLPSGLTTLFLGQNTVPTAGSIANGYLRRIVYYPRRISNAELQSITS